MVLGKGTLYMNLRPSFIHEAGVCVSRASPSPPLIQSLKTSAFRIIYCTRKEGLCEWARDF